MINETTTTSIAPLIATFSQCRAGLYPKPDTILSAVCEVSNEGLALQYNGEVGFHQEWLTSLKNSIGFGTSEPVKIYDEEAGTQIYLPATLHDKTVEEASDIISDAAVKAFNYAKTVVKPTINDFLDQLDGLLETKIMATDPYSIVTIEDNGAWSSNVVAMALEPVTKTGKPVIVTRNTIPQVGVDDDYLKGLSTGNKRLDEQFNQLLNESGVTRRDVFSSIFSGFGNPGTFSDYDRTKGNLYLAQFIMVNMMADNPPSIRMRAAEWQTLMLRLSQAYGGMCGLHQRNIEQSRELGSIVIRYDFSANEVYVDAKAYDKWLSAGGKPETLMGAVIHARSTNSLSNFTGDKLTENAGIYDQAYNRFRSSAEHAEREKRTVRIRQALSTALTNVINDLDMDKFPEGTDKADIAARAVKVIRCIPDYQLEDFGKLGTEIVCDTVFPFTNAKDVICRVGSHIDAGMTSEEAERAAVLGYITDWMLSGIAVA